MDDGDGDIIAHVVHAAFNDCGGVWTIVYLRSLGGVSKTSKTDLCEGVECRIKVPFLPAALPYRILG